ncbi:MAG: FkbM family methyltransferase, partial [Gammaproteobacteria bacterium]
LVLFRSGADLSYAGFTHPVQQYFNNLSLSRFEGEAITYVDGGAFNGDSYRELLSFKSVAVQASWLFEPDPKNYSELVARCMENTKVRTYCIPVGLSDGHRSMHFSSGLGEGGHLSSEGSDTIITAALDELLIGEKIDLIKLDVEGSEESALRGGALTIKTHRPALAISCYHRPDDIWRLPRLIYELVEDYDCYLRQHTFNSFDLVLYAIPRF